MGRNSFQGLLLVAFLLASVAFLVFAPSDSPTGLISQSHDFNSNPSVFAVLVVFVLFFVVFVLIARPHK